jgi:Histidine kinase/Tetratricopeptide repeat
LTKTDIMARFSFIWLLFVLCVNSTAAQQEADSLRKIIRNEKQDSSKVSSLLNLANVIIWQNPSEAMLYTDSAFELATKIKWQKGIALALRQKGLVFYQLSDLVNAMEYSLKALKAGTFGNNDLFHASVDNNLANIYADMGQYQKALEFYNQYKTISEKLNDRTNEMNALVNIGNVYTEMHDLASGLNYFQKALDIAKDKGDKNMQGMILNNMGVIFAENRQFDEAINSFRNSIVLTGAEGNRSAKATALSEMAKVYLNQKKYGQSIAFARQALTASKEAQVIEWQRDAYQTLATAEQALHQPAQALSDFKQYISLRDSILNSQKREELTRKEMQFQFDRKQESEKAEQDRKALLAVAAINRQRYLKNIVALCASVVLIAAVVIFLFYKRKRDAVERQKEAEQKASVSEIEMKVLRLQMNPHFIFNSLNSICDYIINHDPKGAENYLIKFSKVMRYILEYADQKEVSLSEDIKVLEWYMQLEALRLENKFNYEIKIDRSLDPDITMIPPLLFQPFVENSIWHGISGKKDRGKIMIEINRDREMLDCIIEDNGTGRRRNGGPDFALNNTHKSLGMKITQARINILNDLKRSSAKIELQDLNSGLRVILRLPLELRL